MAESDNGIGVNVDMEVDLRIGTDLDPDTGKHAPRVAPARRSEATLPGAARDVTNAGDEVVSAAEMAEALVVIFQNNSTEAITVWPAPEDDIVAGVGIVIQPGGDWEESRHGGAWSAIHDGTGTHLLNVVLI